LWITSKSVRCCGQCSLKEAINFVAKRVEKGVTVSDALNASPFFPPYLVQMAKIGEQQ